MFAPENYRYYRQRAATERRLAEAAASPTLARLHEQLAEAYEAYVAEIQAKRPLRLVGSACDDTQRSSAFASKRDVSATG
jgi:hypothetical protein